MQTRADSQMTHVSRAALAAGSRTFNMASRFLPPHQRNDAAALYAFCRMVDDAADDAPSPEVARSSLATIEDELWGRRAASTFMGHFLAMADRRQVDLRHAQHLIEGVRSDLDVVRIDDDRALHRYCYQVASTVGLMMCGVLGVRERVALPFAVDLGLAMQLTNICRDVREDAGLGRVYLPKNRLAAVGIRQADLVHTSGEVDTDALAQVVRDVLATADTYYRSADGGMRYIPFGPRLAITVASRVYRAIGHKLRRNGANAWAGRTVVGTAGKSWVASGAILAFFGPKIAGWSSPMTHDPDLHIHLEGLPGANPDARSAVEALAHEAASASVAMESVCP